MRLDEMLCQSCSKFHLPRGNRIWNFDEARRACILHGNEEMLKYVQSPHLPRQVYFDVVAAIARSYRFNSMIYNPCLFASSHHCSDGDADIKIEMSARLRGGHLVLKIETVLYAGIKTNAMHNVEKLNQLLHRHKTLGVI